MWDRHFSLQQDIQAILNIMELSGNVVVWLWNSDQMVVTLWRINIQNLDWIYEKLFVISQQSRRYFLNDPHKFENRMFSLHVALRFQSITSYSTLWASTSMTFL